MIFDLKIDARAKAAVASDCRRPRCRYIGSAPSPCQPLCRINRAPRKGLWGEPRAEALDGSPCLRFKPLTHNEKGSAGAPAFHPRPGVRRGLDWGSMGACWSMTGESLFLARLRFFHRGPDRPLQPLATPMPTSLPMSRPLPHTRTPRCVRLSVGPKAGKPRLCVPFRCQLLQETYVDSLSPSGQFWP